MTLLAPHPPESAAPRHPSRGTRGWRVGLGILALGAAVLTGWNVGSGSVSEYYASIALSMSQSWSNFLFGAVDPAGTVTLDKIPGSFWIPALFVKAFGYSAWAVIVPNSLAAVGASILVALTVRRLAGTTGGLLAGAVVATTPILVAVARSNQPETFFVLGLALSAWAGVNALTRRRLSWLILAGAFIGVSFQFYMLEAWAVWPALSIAYLCTRQSWRRRIGHLLIAGAVSIAISLWWVVVMWMIPAVNRPYIGSTLHNDPWEMVFGYNGLGRFGASTADTEAYRSFTPPFSGTPGVFRLFNEQLAGQIAWLLPTAALAVAVLWITRFPRAVTVLVTVWLATFVLMYSTVAGMHQFYTAALAVPMALAIGCALGWARQRRMRWPQIALVTTGGASAAAMGLALGGYSTPVGLAQAVIAAVAVLLLVRESRRPALPRAATAIAMTVSLLLTPTVWCAVTIWHPSATNPVAGGASDLTGAGPGGFAGARGQGAQPAVPGRGARDGQGATGARDGQGATGGTGQLPGGAGAGRASGPGDTALIAWLESNRGDASYLVATFGAQSAASLILTSGGQSVMPIGGFSGTDPVPTLDRFTSLVADGEVRYVLLSAGGAGGFGGATTGSGTSAAGPASEIRSWVQANCPVATGAPSDEVYDCG